MHPLALTLCLLGALCVACDEEARTKDEPAVPVLPDENAYAFGEPREVLTRDKTYVVTWSPVDGKIPINEDFEVDVLLCRNDGERTPVTGAEIAITCFMPDHGHGMLREPRSVEVADGRYRVKGFLLHMDGHWTVSITVVVDGLAATADDVLDL